VRLGRPRSSFRLERRGTRTISSNFVTNCTPRRSLRNGAGVAGEMRMNRFSFAVLIGIVLCTSGNDRSFAAGNGDANGNVASTASPEEAAIQAAAYRARLAARAAADEGYFLEGEENFPPPGRRLSRRSEPV